MVAKPRLNEVGHAVSAAAGVTAGTPGSSRSARSWARAIPGVASRSATPSRSHRRADTSVFVEVALDRLRVLSLQQREPEQHARLLWVEPERRDGAEAVVVHLDVAPHLPRRHARRAHA